MEIGIKIKRLRESRKISQMELSGILGISQTKLCHIESNEDKSVDFILMNRICHYFDVGFHYFLEEQPIPNQATAQYPITCIDFHNNFPESIIAQINFLIADNKGKEQQIQALMAQILTLKNKR